MGQADSDLTLAGSGEFFGHAHEGREGFGFHFLHDVGAMKFDRSLGGSEFAGDLFIEHSRGNEGHDFALARGELFIAFAQFAIFRALFVG